MLGDSSSSKAEVSQVTEEQLLSAAKADVDSLSTTTGGISHGCPKFLPWPNDKSRTVYETGSEAAGLLGVRHRGEITKTARECRVAGNSVTVRYGFSGRVLLGPKGTPGPITFPFSIFVTDSKREKVASDQLTVRVDMAPEKPIGYFSAVKEVTFNVAEGSRPGEYLVYVAFEQQKPGTG